MAKTILRAIAIGLLLIVLPFDFVLLGAIFWIPALCFIAYKKTARENLISFPIIALIVAAAWMRPNQHDLKRFGRFPGNQATIAQLAAAHAVFAPPDHDADLILLPSTNPTKLEIFSAITNQTKLHARIYYCSSGCNLLSGMYSGPISLHEQK